MSRYTASKACRRGSVFNPVSDGVRAVAAALGTLVLVAMLAGGVAPAVAQETEQPPCRQAIVLALDVSGSVDAKEYRLQLDGLAEALTTPRVSDAILVTGAAPIAVHVFEWSGPEFQNVLVPWTRITDQGVLLETARRLAGTERSPSPPSTALGTAMATGARALAQGPVCWTSTLDISGDGKSNTGPDPDELRALPELRGVTVNGLVILTIDSMGAGPGDDDLVAYFETRVIRGPDAFVEVADGFEDYARAMEKKLLREIKTMAVGQLAPTGRLHQ